MQRRRVVVVGAGVVGLSTAVCIAESLPQCSVTVLADRFTPHTTSDVAAGIVMGGAPIPVLFHTVSQYFHDPPKKTANPYSHLLGDTTLIFGGKFKWKTEVCLCIGKHRWFKDTFDHLLKIARSPQAGEAGVSLSSGWQIFRDVPSDPRPYWADDVLGFRFMTDAELKVFPQHKFGHALTTVKCECPYYLPWLQKRFERAGGVLKKASVTDLRELCCDYDLVVNCSGLGAQELVGDSEVYPIRGQIIRVQAPWLKNFIRESDGHTYIYPGRDSVVVGGTRQAGDRRQVVDTGDTKGILERCSQLEPSLRDAVFLEEVVGLRPGRAIPRLEMALLETSLGQKVPVVHNYGHGGWGVSFSWGSAVEALKLVRESLFNLPPLSRL